jgi:DNA polymerase I-like protein with 3'-5' exonuclease and polymerase domains
MLVTENNISEVLKALASETEISLDYETTGLRPYHTSHIFSMVLGTAKQTFYINFQDYPDEGIIGLPLDFIQHFRPILEDASKVFYLVNAKFDMAFLSKFNMSIRGKIYDLKFLERIHYNQHMKYSLEEISKRWGSYKEDIAKKYVEENKLAETIKYPELNKEETLLHYELVPFDIMSKYAIQDGRATLDVGKKILDAIIKEDSLVDNAIPKQTFIVENEARLVHTLFRMQDRGIKVDLDYCYEARSVYKKTCEATSAQFKDLTGIDFVKGTTVFEEVFASEKEKWRKTDKGNWQWNKKVLSKFENKAAQIAGEYAEAKKNLEYFENLIWFADKNGVVHTTLDQAGTKTGRFSCIAKGQKISTLRGDVPIEDVKVDDYVYCYSDGGVLTLSKVLNNFKQGPKECIKLKFQSSGDGRIIDLICTPDHKIKSKKRGWVRADELRRYEKVFHVRRETLSNGRVRVYGSNKVMELEEQIVKREIFKSPASFHIHHIDENKSNNSPHNLAVCTQIGHNYMHDLIENNVIGSHKKTRKAITKFWIYRQLSKSRGKPSVVDMDFVTFKKHCRVHGVNIQEVKKRYSLKGVFLNKTNVQKSLLNRHFNDAAKELGVGHYKLKKLCVKYGITYNHMLRSFKKDGIHETYDLEVEGNHNFIAGEICVHNCYDPNFQNLSSPDKYDDESESFDFPVRKALIPRAGYFFVMIDYAQSEFRLFLEYAKADKLIEEVLNGKDLHQANADIAKVTRKQAKTIGFGLLYGQGIGTLTQALYDTMGDKAQVGSIYKKMINFGITEDDRKAYATCTPEMIAHDTELINKAIEIKNAVLNATPEFKTAMARIKKTAEQRGYLRNFYGRRLQFSDKRFSYQAINHLIQSSCADMLKFAMNKIDDYLLDKESKMLLQLHDELVIEVREGEEYILPEIKRMMEEAYKHKHLPQVAEVSWSKESMAQKLKWEK